MKTLRLEQARIIAEAAEQGWLDQERCAEIRTRYSGRGMYGDECFGIVCPKPTRTAMLLALYLADQNEDALADDLSHCIREDSMGRDSIIYFPSFAWPEEVEVEEIER